jgi:MFS transporter, MHS family, shikimate and dehydroshikimate transport protein
MIATALVMAGGGSLWLVACLWMAFSAMSLVSLLAARDRSKEDIQELDGPTVPAAPEDNVPPVTPAEAGAVRS